MKGYHPEYKPHLRMAAARELIRQIEFDYDEEPTSPTPTHTESTPASERVGASLVGAHDPQPATSDESAATNPANPAYPINPENPDSDNSTDLVIPAKAGIQGWGQAGTRQNQLDDPLDKANPAHPENPVNPDSDKSTEDAAADPSPIPNSELKIENPEVSLARIQRQMHIEDGSVHYRDYAAQYARESESIYQSIIRRASDRPDLESAKMEAEELIGEFDRFMAERDPGYQTIAVPGELIAKTLTQRMDESQPCIFDPADYYDLDRDNFYYCLCHYCEQCDELNYFFEFMRELEEEYEDP